MGFLVSAVLLWMFAYGVVKLADMRSSGRISDALNSHNVVMHPGLIHVTTTALNGWLENVGKRHRRLLSQWFLLGVLMGFLGFFASLFILSSHILAAILPASLVGVPRLPGPLAPFNAAARHVDMPPSVAKFAERSRRWTARGKDKFIKFRKWRRARKTKKRSTFRGYHDRAQQQQRLSTAAAAVDGNDVALNQEEMLHARPALPHSHDHAQGLHPVARFATYLDSRNANVPTRPGVQRSAARHMGGKRREAALIEVQQFQLRPVVRVVAPHAPEHEEAAVRAVPAPPPPPPHPPPRVEQGAASEDAGGVHGNQGPPGSRQFRGAGANTERPNKAMLTLLLPGVTIPASDVGYIAVALLVAMGVHELGHALAAASYDAHVTGVGGFLAFVFPGAYVQLEGVEKLAIVPQLKVYCAGVWHNVVTAALALLLAGALPSLSVVFFAPRAGALVVHVPKQSPLINHLEPGDVITRFGPFPVHDGGRSFRASVTRLVRSNYTAGFCVSGQLYRDHASHPQRCCGQSADADPSLQCFVKAGMPPRRARNRRVCMPTSTVSVQRVCHSSAQCRRGEAPRVGRSLRAAVHVADAAAAAAAAARTHSGGDGASKHDRETCLVAVLAGDARLVDVHIHSVRSGADHRLIYEGFPHVLAHAATVSSYVPRLWSALPAPAIRLLARADIPNHLHRLLTYFASLSLAIAMLNLVPARWLDGEHIVPLFLQLAHPKLSAPARERARVVLVRIGTCLLVLNIGISYAQYGFS